MNIKLSNQIWEWVDNNPRLKSDSQSGIGFNSHSQSFHPVNSGFKSHSQSFEQDFSPIPSPFDKN